MAKTKKPTQTPVALINNILSNSTLPDKDIIDYLVAFKVPKESAEKVVSLRQKVKGGYTITEQDM